MSNTEARREAAMGMAEDNPMPRELRDLIADTIEPHTMNCYADHGDVMQAIDIAYPLICDWLEQHPNT